MGTNIVVLGGNLGKDAAFTAGERPRLNFTLAVNGGYGDKKYTDWFDCVLWGERATKLQDFMRQGTGVVISGAMRSSTYEKEGEKRKGWSVHVNDVQFTSAKESKPSTGDDDSAPF